MGSKGNQWGGVGRGREGITEASPAQRRKNGRLGAETCLHDSLISAPVFFQFKKKTEIKNWVTWPQFLTPAAKSLISAPFFL